jgi:hypothetical protein
MVRARTVAGFATHTDLRPGRPVGLVVRVIVLAQVRGVTFGTHGVPVLAVVGPIEPVVGSQRAVRVEMVPALLPRIPGNRQALQPPAGKRNQVLLQGKPAEGMGDFEFSHLASRPRGGHHEPAFLLIKPGGHTEVMKLGIGEISQNRFIRCHGHGQLVMGALPLVVRVWVAVSAGAAAHECGCRCDGLAVRRTSRAILNHVEWDREGDDECGDDAGEFPVGH